MWYAQIFCLNELLIKYSFLDISEVINHSWLILNLSDQLIDMEKLFILNRIGPPDFMFEKSEGGSIITMNNYIF